MPTLHPDNPRIQIRRPGDPDPDGRCVLYWMQRAQRGRDNPAFEHAISLANHWKKPVLTVFGLTADYPGAQLRHYRFLVDALPEIHDQLAARGVRFILPGGEGRTCRFPLATLESVTGRRGRHRLRWCEGHVERNGRGRR